MSFGVLGPDSISIKPPAAPGNGATVTLFDSAAMFYPKCLRPLNAAMLEVTFNNLDQSSAANGLVSYTSVDSPAAYVQNNMKDDNGVDTMPQTISATDDPRTYRFVLSPFDDFQLKYTAGATGPSVWKLTIALHCGSLAVAR